MEKRKNYAVVCLTAAFLLGFLVWSLLKPDDTVSQSERRKLTQKPELTAASILNGKFMTEFESYTLDQFPLRDSFRRLKAVTLLDVLREPLPVHRAALREARAHRARPRMQALLPPGRAKRANTPTSCSASRRHLMIREPLLASRKARA